MNFFNNGLVLMLLATIHLSSHGQVSNWMNSEHFQNNEFFEDIVHVKSSTNDFIVCHLKHLTNYIPGGNVYETHYIYGIDYSGNELFNFQCNTAPKHLISNTSDHFWGIFIGGDYIILDGDTLTDGSNTANNNLFFVKFNNIGQVVTYNTLPVNEDLYFNVSDVLLDQNNEFYLTGNLSNYTNSSIDFLFNNVTYSISSQTKQHFILNIDVNGNENSALLIESSLNPGLKNSVFCIEQNPLSGSIYIAGRLNDTLNINNNNYLPNNNTGISDLFLLRVSADLLFEEIAIFKAGSYGIIPKDLKFNEQNQHLYLIGQIGSELFLLNPSNPVQGHSGIGNSFIVKLNDLSIVQGSYFIPNDNNSSMRAVLQSNIEFDQNGNILLMPNILDSTFNYNNNTYNLNTPNVNYNFALLLLNQQDLSIIESEFSFGLGTEFIERFAFDPVSQSVYACGTYNGEFSYLNFSSNAVAGNDGLVLKIDQSEQYLTSPAEDINEFENLRIYPNPSKDKLLVKGINTGEFEIYTLNGMLCKKGIYNGNIDVEELNTGLYLLHIISEEQDIYFKFSKL